MSQDNVYFNCRISPTENNQPAIFDQTLTSPLLDNPSDYYCAVLRFNVPINNIPLFKIPVDVTQNNPNITTMVIGVSTTGGVNGTKFDEQVVYIADNTLTAPTPSVTGPTFFTTTQTLSNYYDIFSVVQVLELFNTALAAAVAASSVSATAPYYIFDSTTQLIKLVVDTSFYTSGLSIFMNDTVKNYLSSFRYLENFKPTVEDNFYQILAPLPYGSPTGGPYLFVEESNSLNLWFDLNRIIIKTNTLPVKSESVPSTSNNGAVTYSPILTDFVVGLDDLSLTNQSAIFNPLAQYRLIDMSSRTPIKSVHIAILYSDRFGNTYPLLLDKNQSATIKLGFFKRSLYNNK